MCTGGLGNGQGLEVAIWLLCGLLDDLAYWACFTVCERSSLPIWPVKMASQSMVGLVGGYMDKGGVNPVRNLILDVGVAFSPVGDTQQDLMLVGVGNDVIVSGVARVGSISDPRKNGILLVASDKNCTPVGQGLNELEVD